MRSVDVELDTALGDELPTNAAGPAEVERAKASSSSAAKPKARRRKAPFGRAGVAHYAYANRRFSINPGPDVIAAAARAEEARNPAATEHDLIVVAVAVGEGEAAREGIAGYLAGK